MTRLKNFVFAVAALLVAFVVGPALAQTAPEIVGEWHGVVAGPTGDMTLILYVRRSDGGTLEAGIEAREQAPGRQAPVTEIASGQGRLTFKVPAIRASYSGVWDEAKQQWLGTLTQSADTALNLSKGVPAPKPLVAGLDGVWEGTVEQNGVKLRQVLRIASGEWGTNALYDSPDQLVTGVPLTDIAREEWAVSFAAFRGVAKFAGRLAEDGTQLTGTWTIPNQPDMTTTFTRSQNLAERAPPVRPQHPIEPFPYEAEEVAFDNPAAPGVRLSGTLTLPRGEGPFATAFLITGSGGQDRDEAIMGHRPFAVIAHHLTRNGIAVLRVDDRGIGKSTGNIAQATSADHASDANAAFSYLAARPEIRRDAIGFIGHSEGGIIGPIAMADNDDVAFLVSLAGPGADVLQLLLSQRRLVLAQMGRSDEELIRSEPVAAALFTAMGEADTLEAGYGAATAILTPEAKSALGIPPQTDGALVVREIANPWFRYLVKYDPAPNLARIKVPVLALIGSLDVQVPPKENLPAIHEALKDNPDVTILELPGLNHLFQTATTGAVGEYRDIEETFAPVALELMSDWIRERFVRR